MVLSLSDLAESAPSPGDPTLEIQRQLGNGFHPGTLRWTQVWAICGHYYYLNGRREAEGTALFHRMDGRWQLLVSAGGALDPGYAFRFGVPRQECLKIWSQGPSVWNEGPYWDHLSYSKWSIDDDRIAMGRPWILTLMRNEIYARHGYDFQDPEMRAYYRQRSWYKPGFKTPLTPLEESNAAAILDYQRNKGLLECR